MVTVCETEHEEADESCSPCVLSRQPAAIRSRLTSSHTPTAFVLQHLKDTAKERRRSHTIGSRGSGGGGTRGCVWVERGRI